MSVIENIHERTSYTKFRLSNHQLMIEKGRHLKIEKHCRLCPFCTSKVEEEHHFLLNCPMYTHLRERLFAEIIKTIPDFYYPPDENFLFWFLLKCPIISHCTAHFINQADDLRSFLIAKHKNAW